MIEGQTHPSASQRRRRQPSSMSTLLARSGRDTVRAMPPKHRTTRNDLFVVRFWLDGEGGESERQSSWGGRVQRPVSGESHEFNDWDTLVEALRAMLAATSPSYLAGGLPGSKDDPAAESCKKGD